MNHPNIDVKTLPSGLRLILIPRKKVPVVSMNMAYKVGSKNEVRNMTGFAHLFEHLMFEGTKNIPKGEFDRYCSSAGGTNNAYTSYDITSYIMALPTHQLELGLWLESDRLYNSEVTPEALENQQKVVTEEIRQTVENQPYGRWRELLAASAFKSECTYSWEVHGSIKDVESATIEDTTKFFNSYYRPENACLVLCGDFDPDRTYELVEKYFSQSKKTNGLMKPAEFNDSFKIRGSKDSYKDNVPFGAVFVSFHANGFPDKNIYKADIISHVFGGGRSSRLYNSLVYQKQIASSTGAFVDKRENASLITFYAVANSDKVTPEDLYSEFLEEIEVFNTNGLKDHEMEKAINQLSTSVAYELQYSGGIADLAGHRDLFHRDPKNIFKIIDNYTSLDGLSVKKYANSILIPGDEITIKVEPSK